MLQVVSVLPLFSFHSTCSPSYRDHIFIFLLFWFLCLNFTLFLNVAVKQTEQGAKEITSVTTAQNTLHRRTRKLIKSCHNIFMRNDKFNIFVTSFCRIFFLTNISLEALHRNLTGMYPHSAIRNPLLKLIGVGILNNAMRFSKIFHS